MCRIRDIAGGYGWLDLHIGYDKPLSDNVCVSPTVSLWVNFVIVDGGRDDESFANTIILPAMKGRYVFDTVPSAYLAGEINYGIPDSGGKRYDLEEGDIGYGVFLGYETDTNCRFEIGYSQVPTTVVMDGPLGPFGGRREEEVDFGGVVLRVTSTL